MNRKHFQKIITLLNKYKSATFVLVFVFMGLIFATSTHFAQAGGPEERPVNALLGTNNNGAVGWCYNMGTNFAPTTNGYVNKLWANVPVETVTMRLYAVSGQTLLASATTTGLGLGTWTSASIPTVSLTSGVQYVVSVSSPSCSLSYYSGTAPYTTNNITLNNGVYDNGSGSAFPSNSGGGTYYGLADVSFHTGTEAFTSSQSGNFNIGTTWGGACSSNCIAGTDYPNSGNGFIVANGHTVTLTGNYTVPNATINSGGTLSLGSNTLTVSDASTPFVVNGIFTPGTGTIEYSGTATAVTNTTYYGLKISGSVTSSTTATVTNNLNVTGTFTPSGGTITFNTGSSITNSGTLTFFNLTTASSATVSANISYGLVGTLTNGSGATLTSNSGTQTFSNGSTIINNGTQLTFNNLTIASSATLNANTSYTVAGTLTISSSAILSPTSGTITLSNTGTPLSISGTFNPTGSNTVQYSGSTNTVNAITFQNLTLGGSGTYTMPATTLTIKGDLTVTNGATVTKGNGTVVFSGTSNQTITDNNSTNNKQDLGNIQDSNTATGWCNISSTACNSSWLNRKKITFDNSASSTDLTNFPVLITITSSNIDYAKTKAGGADIRFVDSDNSTALSYEIEKWNAAGTSLIWVKVPQLDHTNTDFIYMYYNNTSATDNQTPTGVWDSSYKAVYHLSDGTTLSVADSTTANNGTNHSATATTGKVDGGISMNGSSQYFDATSNSGLNTYPLTISGWIKTSDSSSAAGVINKYAASSLNGYQMFMSSGHLRAWYFKDGSNYIWDGGNGIDAGAINDNTWHYVSFTVNSSGGIVYIDGANVASRSWYGTPGATTSSQNLQIGMYANGLTGQMDEVRVSNLARSADWIKTEYNTERDAMNTFGSEETYGSSGLLLGSSIKTTTVTVGSASALSLNGSNTLILTSNDIPVSPVTGTDTFTSSGTWTAPAGATWVSVETWGAGGGGGVGDEEDPLGGSGGGGGGYSKINYFAVTAGNSYTVTVGTGGSGGSGRLGTGSDGNDSWFNSSSTVKGSGGKGGSYYLDGTHSLGGGGLGDVVTTGGTGGTDINDLTGCGAGGGGGAGNTANGGNGGLYYAPGTGGSSGGGNGGTGNCDSAGGNGSTLGGGGSGAAQDFGNGGTGARGEVRITYHNAAVPYVKALVVGGGGGGSYYDIVYGEGGGGAGGMQYNQAFPVTAQAYSVTVGAGGAVGANGSDSVFSTITSLGGGRGGQYGQAGASGGSGGGGGSISEGGCPAIGTGTPLQGHNGGNCGGGGGGAGGNGGGGSGNGGAQGAGLANSISGSSVTYAVGGQGSSSTTTSLGGAPGQAASSTQASVAGAANKGGGGGAGYRISAGGDGGKAGGSGVVIIAFPTDGSTGVSTSSTGGTITTVGGNQIHTFTSGGTFTMVAAAAPNAPPFTVNGTFDASTGTVDFSSSGTTGTTIPNYTYYNVTVNKSGNTFTPPNPFTVHSLTITAGTFSAPATLTVTGDFSNSGTFTHNNGNVIIAPNSATKTSQILGSTNTTFYNFTNTTGESTLQFQHGDTFTFSHGFTVTGTNGHPIWITSDSPGSQWTATFSVAPTVNFINLKDSTCSGGISISPGLYIIIDQGNNGTCWGFVRYSGGGGSSGSDSRGNTDGESGGGGGPGGGNIQATATANRTGSTITTVTVNIGGAGYTTIPSICFQDGSGSGATAVATISNGAVTVITVTAVGQNYTSGVTVGISPPPGTGGSGCSSGGGGGPGGGGGGSP